MTNLRQSFDAAKYHKKMTISLFVVFSLLLLLFCFITQLIDTQKFTLSYLLGKWDQLKKILPQFDSNLNHQLIKSNELMLSFYDSLRLILFIFAFLIFFSFSLYAAKIRKEEIYSLNYIGIKRRHILPRMLLELLIPVLFSLPFIFCLMLVFHNQFLSQSIQVNQKVMGHYFQTDNLFDKETLKNTEVDLNEDEHFNLTTSNEKTLLPYNKASILDVKLSTNSFTQVFMMLLTNFMLLFGNMIVAYSAGFYCYTTFGFRRRRLIG